TCLADWFVLPVRQTSAEPPSHSFLEARFATYPGFLFDFLSEDEVIRTSCCACAPGCFDRGRPGCRDSYGGDNTVHHRNRAWQDPKSHSRGEMESHQGNLPLQYTQ